MDESLPPVETSLHYEKGNEGRDAILSASSAIETLLTMCAEDQMDKHLEALKKPYTCRSTVKYVEEACFLASQTPDVGEAELGQVWIPDEEPMPA